MAVDRRPPGPLDQVAGVVSAVREAVGIERPPDPRPPLPARRPPDRLDRSVGVVAGGLVIAAAVAVALPGDLASLIALVLVLTAIAVVARRVAREASWQARRRAHRRSYREDLSELYDRYRVEVVHEGEEVVLRLRRYEPSPLARLGRTPRPLYRAVTCAEERYPAADDIAAIERLAELQAEAEERESAARRAYRTAADARERLRTLHGSSA